MSTPQQQSQNEWSDAAIRRVSSEADMDNMDIGDMDLWLRTMNNTVMGPGDFNGFGEFKPQLSVRLYGSIESSVDHKPCKAKQKHPS